MAGNRRFEAVEDAGPLGEQRLQVAASNSIGRKRRPGRR
jgi:hypothetical protein